MRNQELWIGTCYTNTVRFSCLRFIERLPIVENELAFQGEKGR